MLDAMAFYLFAAVTAGAGLYIVLTRKLIYAAFALFFMLFGVAGLFVLNGAGFLAISQIIVYVGGILILLLFGVMLTTRETENDALPELTTPPATRLINLVPGLLGGGGMFGLLLWAFREVELTAAAPPKQDAEQLKHLGTRLLTDYLLAFELISVLLLVALIGAAYAARREPPQPRDTGQPYPTPPSTGAQ